MVRSAPLALLLCYFCGSSATAQLSVRRSSEGSSPEESTALSTTISSNSPRELIFSFTDPLTQFCENIEVEWNVFLGLSINSGILCTCSGSIFPPAITTGCTNELCLGTIACISPKLEVGFDLLNLFRLMLPLSAKICLGGIEVLGFGVVGELCFDFFNPITGLFSSFFSSDSARAVSPNNFSNCLVKVDGQTCDVCELCTHSSGGTGVRFGCPGFESAGCTLLSSDQLPKETKMAINVDAVVLPDIVATSD
jgi:hypothetical protein